jgi:dihydrodipicolinate reductase
MRIVIAGAGGRMGRTLIHAIAATKGLTLAGAVDAPGSAVIGRDAGELAGLGANGVKVTADVGSGSILLKKSPQKSCKIEMRNNRIRQVEFLNQCCAPEASLESILLGRARKIFF